MNMKGPCHVYPFVSFPYINSVSPPRLVYPPGRGKTMVSDIKFTCGHGTDDTQKFGEVTEAQITKENNK
ncbi:Uncharacterized protein TCM_000889 [Theobroma cacao]|uniref:Uncharacterized protein n=1 Tax=Theobroma cacao TaxID=3641 RepID=A0A061DHX9_THECC|nr:Uncharacterized protein TCM_000889 [Theobroma cacao]